MKQRIFHSILFVSMISLVITFLGMIFIIYDTDYQRMLEAMEVQSEVIGSLVENTGDAYLTQMDTDSYRLNWIGADGQVLYDSLEDPEIMTNHLDRQEIQQAQKQDVGTSIRYSDTLSEQTFYVARQLKDGSFIRVSVTMTSMYGFLMQSLLPFVILLGIVLVTSLLLATKLSDSIVKPIVCIDLDHPLQTHTYPQLQPLLDRIEQSNQQIKKQMKQLKRKSEEFEAVVNHMDEGLILLSKDQQVLSCNDAAGRVFGMQEDWNTQKVPRLEEAIGKASQNGHSTFTMKEEGRYYTIEVSSINNPPENKGFVILILDTTEKKQAAKRRREFTANVTHELKTPIQTIMSSAELLENRLVREEDIPRFLEYISRESAHLLEMVNNIIHLSRLDIQDTDDKEVISLSDLVKTILSNYEMAARQKNLHIKTRIEDITCYGSLSNMKEIISNLLDNAIKYNNKDGSITIDLYKDKDQGVFSIEDTGIGIPLKYQERVFERFFRVDKSHSQSTGGTGLGLAIVSHGVQAIGGTITMNSEEGKGTTITVRFPLQS